MRNVKKMTVALRTLVQLAIPHVLGNLQVGCEKRPCLKIPHIAQEPSFVLYWEGLLMRYGGVYKTKWKDCQLAQVERW